MKTCEHSRLETQDRESLFDILFDTGLTENITDSDIEPLRQVKFLYDTCTDTSKCPVGSIMSKFYIYDVYTIPRYIIKTKT
jgi:hypothetical protein